MAGVEGDRPRPAGCVCGGGGGLGGGLGGGGDRPRLITNILQVIIHLRETRHGQGFQKAKEH